MLGRIGQALSLLVVLSAPVTAHEWYPDECCHERDCYHVSSSTEVLETAQGFYVVPSGELIRYDDPRVRYGWVEEGFHRCTAHMRPNSPTICLFPPNRGF